LYVKNIEQLKEFNDEKTSNPLMTKFMAQNGDETVEEIIDKLESADDNMEEWKF